MSAHTSPFPELGFGLGLRTTHYTHIFAHKPKVDWFEIISENFMDTGGRPLRNLARIRADYPVVMHGVSMSIGTVDPLNSDYLEKLKNLIAILEPAWISDHLCWTGVAHKNTHDLLPVPYTEEALKHIVSRIQQVQEYLGRPIALENPSTYLEFKTSTIAEAQFIAEMAQQSGCNLLLDVNNVYVSCFNHRLDTKAYLDALPLEKVIQIHLSGHSNMGTHIVDTHDDYVVDEVWALYKYVVNKAGRTPNTMVEWDDNIPDFPVLFAELEKAKQASRYAAEYDPLPELLQEQARYVPNRITPLPEAQHHMQQAILGGAAVDSRPEEWIRAKAEFLPEAQLAVYVNAYRFRLYDVTAEEYPALKYAMGDAPFDQLLKDYVNTQQSTHFNIAHYSTFLPAFLKKQSSYTPFLLELAVLEDAITRMADLPETEPLTPAQMEGVSPEMLLESRLYPRKALELFAFDVPVNRFYRAVKEEQSPTLPEAEKSFVVVFRHEDVVWRMDLSAHEHFLLQKLFSGLKVGEALEALHTERGVSEEEILAHLAEWFARWMRNGLLASNEYSTETHNRNNRSAA